MNIRFGENMRNRRHALDLTLGELAARSDVSRAALSKIERGERNPSLNFAVRIAEALQTPLAELVGQLPGHPTVVRDGQAPRFVDPASGSVRESLLKPQAGVELARYSLPPHAAAAGFPAHPAGTNECFVVLAGDVTLTSGDTTLDLSAGDAAMLPSDRDHTMANPTDQQTYLLLLITHRPGRP